MILFCIIIMIVPQFLSPPQSIHKAGTQAGRSGGRWRPLP